jgi:hypothetical protein
MGKIFLNKVVQVSTIPPVLNQYIWILLKSNLEIDNGENNRIFNYFGFLPVMIND